MRVALTIAGSDPSCGAGVQADLKTFQRCGVYGVCAVTAVTAQDGARIRGVYPLPPRCVSAQVEAVARKFRIDAVKTGMLWSEGIIREVRRILETGRFGPLVVDPVIASHSGAGLMARGAARALVRHLFPLADLVTPNLIEAGRLTGVAIRGEGDVREAAARLAAMGPRAVLIKGGHARGSATDWYHDGTRFTALRAKRYRTARLHGSGCILAAAAAAGLAKGLAPSEAVSAARAYVRREMRRGWNPGSGVSFARHN